MLVACNMPAQMTWHWTYGTVEFANPCLLQIALPTSLERHVTQVAQEAVPSRKQCMLSGVR